MFAVQLTECVFLQKSLGFLTSTHAHHRVLRKIRIFLHVSSEPKLYIVVWAGKYGQTRVCREEKEEGDV